MESNHHRITTVVYFSKVVDALHHVIPCLAEDNGIEPLPGTSQQASFQGSLTSKVSIFLLWCPLTESNCRPRITKPLYYHCTKRANWKCVTESNRANWVCSPGPLPLGQRIKYFLSVLEHLCKQSYLHQSRAKLIQMLSLRMVIKPTALSYFLAKL